ncbi:Crp/Fnr family transcriptional regulator [Pedobacter sp. HDW13]|nr:Crp/Fnr family transcriptional regulator [Pedobacter sp. HDW13]
MTNIPDNGKWGSYNGRSPLVSFCNKYHLLTGVMEALINAQTFPVHYRKHSFIVTPNDTNRYIYLIMKGVVRGFYKDSGFEITTWICHENEIVGAINNPWKDEPSHGYIQALEDVELIAVPRELITMLYGNFSEADIIGRKMMELYYRVAYDRALICQVRSATGRYRYLLKVFPWMIGRVPLIFIASFLGLRLETLSRTRASEIRKKTIDHGLNL